MKNKYRFVIFGYVFEMSYRKQSENAWPSTDWQATHRHRKGGEYRRLCNALLEGDESNVVVYDDSVGNIWVRSKAEFDDGRFTLMTD
ncbi:MAG: hypothetical protein ACJAXK_002547 [Yoonia sp.]|jgi:hypothetical protein